jgi:putative DNA methylase
MTAPDELTFIETQFPVAKLTKEALKERRANNGQTLTGIGKWWGRKQLIIVRASILGMLMPASKNQKRDHEIFLRLLTMDDESLWDLRCDPSKTWTCNLTKKSSRQIEYEYASPSAKREFFEHLKNVPQWLSGTHLPSEERSGYRERKAEAFRRIFERLPYEHKLRYCVRPEEIGGPSKKAWKEINQHLKTSAQSLHELIGQLGQRRFNHKPRLADPFCGGGSIPFEAARIGCETIASDLNPVAGLLTWGSLNLLGGGETVQRHVMDVQAKVLDAALCKVKEWGIEQNEAGETIDALLYCVEVKPGGSDYFIPLAPCWLVGEKSKVVCRWGRIEGSDRLHPEIAAVSESDVKAYIKKKDATLVKDRVVDPFNRDRSWSLEGLRGARGLRRWSNEDITHRSTDVFQERLYCIRWIDKDGNRRYAAPTQEDLTRERKVIELLNNRFKSWQRDGFIPSRAIPETGRETARLIRERGWTHWHHLFTPRQLLTHGLLAELSNEIADSKETKAGCLLGLGRIANWDSRQCGWMFHKGNEKGDSSFNNLALNTLVSYSGRPLSKLSPSFMLFDAPKDSGDMAHSKTRVEDAKEFTDNSDLWITDPPYSDAVNYGELGEFFFSWYEKLLASIFPDWSIGSSRDAELSGGDHHFRIGMRDCYKRFADNMPANGMQIVMFTHQDPEIWADLALILWSAGLRVTAAWVIETELTTGLRTGAYVQGTVLLVLRKRTNNEVGNLGAAWPKIRIAIARQLENMKRLDESLKEPNFCDADLHLAAYAAALSVLTNYSKIIGVDPERDIARPRERGERTVLGDLIRKAEQVAADYLVPPGLTGDLWRDLQPVERFYLKGLESEFGKDKRIGTYQNYARTFGVGEYSDILGETRDHATRMASPSELGPGCIRNSPIAEAPMGRLLFAIQEVSKSGDPSRGERFLRDEFPDFWDRRKAWIALLEYLEKHLDSDMREGAWADDAESIELLTGRLRSANV